MRIRFRGAPQFFPFEEWYTNNTKRCKGEESMLEVYMEYGAIGIIVSLFVMMIMNLIKSQKLQNEDLDDMTSTYI